MVVDATIKNTIPESPLPSFVVDAPRSGSTPHMPAIIASVCDSSTIVGTLVSLLSPSGIFSRRGWMTCFDCHQTLLHLFLQL